MLPNSSYEANIALIPKPRKHTTRKNNSNHNKNNRPTTLMNVEAKIFNKIQQIEFNSTFQRLYTMIKQDSSLRYKDGSIYANQ